jgi:hypothetical protein
MFEMTPEDLDIVKAISISVAPDEETDEKAWKRAEATRKRAKAMLAFHSSADIKTAIKTATEKSGLEKETVRYWWRKYKGFGWSALITVRRPRGGDFLARYDQGFWAEKLTREYLDKSDSHRAIPYGTSRSKPFTKMDLFKEYMINEMKLQAWSGSNRWKRPDLVMLPLQALENKKGNDRYPDLIHWDNNRCSSYIQQSTAGIEVETSLWLVSRAVAASVQLSFTVKTEDLAALRSWVKSNNNKALYIIQIFYDQAHVLPFSRLESLIQKGEIKAKADRETGKETYFVPLQKGCKLGDIPEPKVKSRVFIAENGKVTIYGQLNGSKIKIDDEGREILEKIANGTLI